MAARPHILVVNGRKVRQPVFVIGAPYSGTDVLARALKQSAGIHMTIGQPAVTSVVHAFARSPSIQRGKGEAATTVLRDAFAQAWQVTPDSCLGCSAACRSAGGVTGAGTCIAERDILRYGDASPDLMYCAESLVEAFGDARIVQIIRDGRDVVASMLGDTALISVFRPSLANVEGDLPNPFFGLEQYLSTTNEQFVAKDIRMVRKHVSFLMSAIPRPNALEAQPGLAFARRL